MLPITPSRSALAERRECENYSNFMIAAKHEIMRGAKLNFAVTTRPMMMMIHGIETCSCSEHNFAARDALGTFRTVKQENRLINASGIRKKPPQSSIHLDVALRSPLEFYDWHASASESSINSNAVLCGV
jgi:hypothetical protein